MALNFLEVLNKEKGSIESDNKEEIPTPKNDVLRVGTGKNAEKELIIRLLPSVSLLKGSPDASLGVKQRSIMFDLTFHGDTGDKKTFTSLNLPEKYDRENITEQKVSEWSNRGVLNGKYGVPTPRNVYWINVLQVVNKNNAMHYVEDEDGNPKVFAFQATSTVYKMLLDKLTDPLADFGDTLEDSLLGWGKSYPVKVVATDNTTRTVDLYTSERVSLPPIEKELIIKQLDSFSILTKPSDETQPEWFATVKRNLDGSESLAQNISDADLEDPFATSGDGNSLLKDDTDSFASDIDPFAVNKNHNDDRTDGELLNKSVDSGADDEVALSTEKQAELDNILAGL